MDGAIVYAPIDDFVSQHPGSTYLGTIELDVLEKSAPKVNACLRKDPIWIAYKNGQCGRESREEIGGCRRPVKKSLYL